MVRLQFWSSWKCWVFLHWQVYSVPEWLLLEGHIYGCPVGWSCRIRRLRLFREVRPRPHDCPGYDTKQSHGEAPVILEVWGMHSTPLLPSLPGPLWPGVVAPDKVLSMGKIELNYVVMLNWIIWIRTVWHWNCVLMLNWTVWNRTVFE